MRGCLMIATSLKALEVWSVKYYHMSISSKTQKPRVHKLLIYLPGDIAALICLEAA